MPGSARSRPCRLFLFVTQIRNEGRSLSGQTSGVSGCSCPVLNNVVYLSYPLAKFLFRCYGFIKYFFVGRLVSGTLHRKNVPELAAVRQALPPACSLFHPDPGEEAYELHTKGIPETGRRECTLSLAQPVRFQPRRGPGLFC